MTTDELGFDTAHRPGALTRYFAKRWLEEPTAKGERLIAWLLEAALGRNTMHFIERTKEYVDAWGGRGEVVPVDAFDGFVITGDPVEDTFIPHAVLVWTYMNDRPWEEEVYHRWLDTLLAAGSAEAAYLAASLWPAHDLMAKVAYRPAGWLVYRGQFDAEAERLILTEMLKGEFGPRVSLYGSFEYDDAPNPKELPKQYIERHGFTHPICGLVWPRELERDSGLKERIQEALAAPSWSEGTKGAAMLLYLLLKRFEIKINEQDMLNILEKNLFKLDERHINIINFHMDKIEKIDYDLIKDYINYLIILYDQIIDYNILSMKVLGKYISIGLKTNDILYIGKSFKNIIFNLMLKEKEKVESWLENNLDDLRIRDVLIALYMSDGINYGGLFTINIKKELKTEHLEKEVEDICGKIRYFDKINFLIYQAKIYFNKNWDPYKICGFIEDILKRELKIDFSFDFKGDYEKIIHSWHPNRNFLLGEDMFLKSNHIGLYLYYGILKGWRRIDLIDHIKKEKEINLYLNIKNKIIKNLYGQISSNIEIKISSYLNKIENNNLPCKEIKNKLIIELIDIIENNYDKILECFKDINNLKLVKKVILSNIDLFRDKLKNSRLIALFGVDYKSKNTIIY